MNTMYKRNKTTWSNLFHFGLGKHTLHRKRIMDCCLGGTHSLRESLPHSRGCSPMPTYLGVNPIAWAKASFLRVLKMCYRTYQQTGSSGIYSVPNNHLCLCLAYWRLGYIWIYKPILNIYNFYLLSRWSIYFMQLLKILPTLVYGTKRRNKIIAAFVMMQISPGSPWVHILLFPLLSSMHGAEDLHVLTNHT